MKIILDAMGGDNAPEAPVLGAVEAAKTYGIEIVLVGRGEDILAVLKKHGIDNLPEGMEISNADDVVDMHDDPASIIHKRKNSSMVIGLKMLADGLAEEVSRLLKGGVPRDAKAMKAIGYKEMIPYALGETTLDEAVYALKLNTRHYAKRQLTWMRREEDVLWVDALEPDAYDKLEAYYTQGEAK